MEYYDVLDEYVDDHGELDYDSLLHALEENPELLADAFQNLYGDLDTPYVSEPVSLQDLYTNCMIPNVSSAVESVFVLVLCCLLCHVVTRASSHSSQTAHVLYTLTGIFVIYKFFHENSVLVVFYCLICCSLLVKKSLWKHSGVILSCITVIFVVACEFFVEPERWHNVRGAQMILSMKVISVGFDLKSEDIKEFDTMQLLSYFFHPGTVIFGPWLSYKQYFQALEYSCKNSLGLWAIEVVKTAVLSAVYLLSSTCLITWLIPPDHQWGNWASAYRDAQSFRFSHYFVCSLGEMALTLSGILISSRSGLIDRAVISKPVNIELPRSLVSVVTSWNLPMHYWLKTYVFRVFQPDLGTFPAIFLTYVASSLLHGLNFQLAAVLLSLGFYSYIEHRLRSKLSEALNSCCQVRSCDVDCQHTRKACNPLTCFTNVSFTLLSMFHLAYLGVMFDTSQGEMERGYSMSHTLSKWSELGYRSHIVVLSCYFFYWLIK